STSPTTSDSPASPSNPPTATRTRASLTTSARPEFSEQGRRRAEYGGSLHCRCSRPVLRPGHGRGGGVDRALRPASTCKPDCSLASLGCVHGACDDSSGTALCACEAGYAGALCDACAPGYQDNDGDGTCEPGCDMPGVCA